MRFRRGDVSAITPDQCLNRDTLHEEHVLPSGQILTGSLIAHEDALAHLGWSAFFADQIAPDEAALVPMRVAEVHRDRLSGISVAGRFRPTLPEKTTSGDFAVGDWVIAEPDTHLLRRRLDRKTLLQRRTEGKSTLQLIAANVDTLFIVTSCNADFDIARLERYLAMANEAGTNPVILLTKADKVDDAQAFQSQAMALQNGLQVVALNAKSTDAVDVLSPWCGMGQTVALVGSSGVGKSTLVNTLAGAGQEQPQQTGAIREHDAKGRHTTTARSLHPIAGGGWVIDTPGMRTLHVSDVAEGIDALFTEITDLAPSCKFNDCSHTKEPGCAVQAAVAAGTLPVERLDRWRKLIEENRSNTRQQTGPRGNKIFRKKY
jgi:ribosome biogenesis GTPase